MKAKSAKPKPRRSAPQASKAPEGLGYVDGKVLDLAKARVPLNDRGYLLGDGVFETLRTNGTHLFRLDDHAARLRSGLAALGLDESVEEDFRSAVGALVAAGHKAYRDDLYLRINVSTGPMDGIAGDERGITVTGLAKRFKPYPMQYYAKGIHVVPSRQRKHTQDPLATVKTMSFLPYVAARREAHAATAHDALLFNEHGRVAEASTSNVFARKGDTVYAPGPKEGALPGVTRAVVLGLVEEAGFKVEEALTVAQLRGASEAWLTNTTGGIVPVTRFDDQAIGKGGKGTLTAQLSHGLEALLRNHHA